MHLKNLIEDSNVNHDSKKDSSIADKSDTRKTRLTLEQINRLRMLNDVKITEYSKTIKQVKQQYSKPAEDSGGGL